LKIKHKEENKMTNENIRIENLTNPQTLKGEKSVEEYKQIWLEAFPQALVKGIHFWKRRLKDLQTFDTCNGKENERQGKIQALKILIKGA
jgi:hypothetical protein